MTIRCEDYPCCGHTDGLGCNWTAPTFENPEDLYEPGSQEYWDARWEREEDEDDEDDICYDCGESNDDCVCDDGEDAFHGLEDSWLDGSYEE